MDLRSSVVALSNVSIILQWVWHGFVGVAHIVLLLEAELIILSSVRDSSPLGWLAFLREAVSRNRRFHTWEECALPGPARLVGGLCAREISMQV